MMGSRINSSKQITPLSDTNRSLAEKAVWRAVTRGGDGAVQDILKDRKNESYKLINTTRTLGEGEIQDDHTRDDYIRGEYSLLFIAIYRNLDQDAKYLIQQRNINLTARCGYDQRTALFEAVLREKHDIVLHLLRCPSVSPSQHVNIGDRWSFTPLHQIAMNCSFSDGPKLEHGQRENNSKNLKELIIHGANIDALNGEFRTPLHVLASQPMNEEAAKCVQYLLHARAEVNTKDELGASPLHEACKNGDRTLIKMLLEHGADLDSRNLYWMTPQDLFYQNQPKPLSEEMYKFAKSEFSAMKRANTTRRGFGNIPTQPEQCPEEMRNVCSEFPVYLRYHWTGLDATADNNNSVSWVRTDMKVSEVLYFREIDLRNHFEEFRGGPRFLADCETRFTKRILDSPELYRESLPNEAEKKDGEEEKNAQREHNMEKMVEESVKKNAWRWINFPSNNMTWIKDFIIHNSKYGAHDQVDRRTWQFLENSIKVRETNTPYSRVRTPHVYVTRKSDSHDQSTKAKKKVQTRKRISTETSKIEFGLENPHVSNKEAEKSTKPDSSASWSDTDGFKKSGSMISLVVPFLDIETEDQIQQDDGEFATQCERIKKLNEAYFPFTGMHGVQRAQTLDQTSYNFEGENAHLRSEKNQVIYRWSKKRNEERKLFRRRQPPKQGSQSRLKEELIFAKDQWEQGSNGVKPEASDEHSNPGLFERLLSSIRRAPTMKEAQGIHVLRRPTLLGTQHDSIREERAGRLGASATNAERVRQDLSPKWLMVRQLWLWKLDDNTILTAIPSRQNGMTADSLLETIRQGNLETLRTPEDLVKRILNEAVSFLDEFKWAGLGEHVLDIFQGEIAAETKLEADFYENFSKADWSPRDVNKTVEAAAKSTWRVKDIRDELRLLRQVFESQLKVVEEFADKFWPSKIPDGTNQDRVSWKTLRDSFIRDTSLRNMIERVKRMDEDASTTLQGLSNIMQAMQAQASLKEAEAARVMNIIILPFTIVTVIFTPLSFLTSLFAVNTLSFPHNDDGELRLPGTWFTWRMVVGELGSLIPLLLLVGLIYYWQVAGSDERASTKRLYNIGKSEKREMSGQDKL